MLMRALLVMTCIWLNACSVLQAPATAPIRTYVLELPKVSAAPVAPNMTGAVLVVAAPKTRPGYDTSRMAYVKRDYALDYYANSQWADTPARLLQPLLMSALEATGHYRAVLRAPAAVSAGLRLDTEIVRLEQVFSSPPSRVHITVRAQLIDTQKSQVLGTRVFEATASAPSDDAYGGVRAANQALAQLLSEVAAFSVSLSGP